MHLYIETTELGWQHMAIGGGRAGSYLGYRVLPSLEWPVLADMGRVDG